MFEQVDNLRQDHGLISHDSLVTVRPGKKIFVPLHNRGIFTWYWEELQVGTAVVLNKGQIGEVEVSCCNRVQNKGNAGSGSDKP